MRAASTPYRFLCGLGIAAWFLWFAGAGLNAPFTGDDLMNLHYYASRTFPTVLLDHLRYWSPAYRPLGGLFYLSLYKLSGFHPMPFRIVCFLLLGLNLALLFKVCRALSQSAGVAFLAVFLFSYHAWFVDLYYSSGTIYDILCFTCYFGALAFYVNIRGKGARLTLGQVALVAALYIGAMNAKEMAITLPLFLLIYELLFHREKVWRTTLVTTLFTIPYIIGKLTGGSLAEDPAYRLAISPLRFLKTFHLYLNPLFYQDHFFHDSNTLQLLLIMLAIALWRRSRSMLFAWLFLLLSLLPVAFVAHYSAFFLYIPAAGWALYLAEFLAMAARCLTRGSALAEALAGLALVIGLAIVHTRESRKTLHAFTANQPPTRDMTTKLLSVIPRMKMKPGARVLYIDDPFPKDQYFLVFLTTLLYHDLSLEVARTSVQPALAAHPENFDVILLFRDGRLTALKS